jgi:SAM-dependent methyltransferase
MEGFFNRLKAQWYSKGLKFSDFPKTATSFILPRTRDAKTFLDVGAGCGTLAIPLARGGKSVTALDPSRHMIDILKDEMKRRRIRNIKPVLAAWGEAEVKPHDVIICANVPALLKGPTGFLEDARRLAKKAVFLIVNADPEADKFYYKELYPLLFNRPFEGRGGYFDTYRMLYEMGIFANVEMIEYDFDQPFDSMDEAVEFWKEYIGIVTEEHDKKLRDFLSGKLVKRKGVLLAKFHKKSAIIWWRKEKKAGK